MFGKSVPVFCYHAVCEEDGHTPEQFASHLDAIAEAGFKTISALHLYEICMGRKPIDDKYVVLTFDDCHISNWINVVPMLEERGMVGVFFVITDFIGEGKIRARKDVPAMENSRDSFIKALSEKDYSNFMNEAELKSLVHDKGMEVYAHTCKHQGAFIDFRQSDFSTKENAHWSVWGIYRKVTEDLPFFSYGSGFTYDGFWPVFRKGKVFFKRRSVEKRREFCREDFKKSLARAKEINGARRQFFCWPWGTYDHVSLQEAVAAGFDGTFTLERSANKFGTDPMRMHRIGVGASKDASWIKKRLAMYSNSLLATLCFKYFSKKNDIAKVLYLTDTEKLSGGSRQLINSASAMVAAGLEVHAILKPESLLIPELEDLGVKVEVLDNFKSLITSGSFLAEYISSHEIDVVHTYHNKSVKLGCAAKVLSLIGGCKFKLFFNRGVIYKPNPLAPIFSLIGDGYICNSATCRDILLKHFVPAKRVDVVYNSLVSTGRKPRRNSLVTIIYVGNEAKAKGPDVFLKAVEKLLAFDPYESIRFVAVGIKDINKFKGIVSDETLKRVESLGYISHDKVVRQLAISHIYVMSSRQESMPNTLIEAFDAGLASVCTNAGGTSELIQDGKNGFLCDVEDSEAIALSIKKLLDDGDLRKEMGRINRKIVRSLMSKGAKATNLLTVYNSLPKDGPFIKALDIDSLVNDPSEKS